MGLPPRTGKSQLCSLWTPTWFLENWPDKEVILGAHTADFAASWGRRVRNHFDTYTSQLATRLSEDSKAAHRWNTTAGGGMVTAGVGGPVLGKGADLLILDDPIKNSEEANSLVERDKLWDWWTTTFLTRREPGAVVVLIMHRWHEDDLWARAMKPENNDPDDEPWEVINLPAIAEENDPLGREVGRALWPERYDEKRLKTIRYEIGERAWVSLFQQRPPRFKGGEVYYAFSEANVDATIKACNATPISLAIDFNINPGCHGIVFQHNYSPNSMRAIHEIHEAGMHVRLLARAFIEWVKKTGGWRWSELWLFGDASGQNRNASDGQSSWDVLRSELALTGWPMVFKVPAANPPVSKRIDATNNLLCDATGHRGLKVHPSCVRLINDFKAMRWDGNELDKRDRRISHASDGLGYACDWLFGVDLKTVLDELDGNDGEGVFASTGYR